MLDRLLRLIGVPDVRRGRDRLERTDRDRTPGWEYVDRADRAAASLAKIPNGWQKPETAGIDDSVHPHDRGVRCSGLETPASLWYADRVRSQE